MELLTKEKAALSRVVELAPETDFALRIAASRSGDRVEVERLYKKALALAPADYDTNIEYGRFLNFVGRPTEAIDYIKRLVRWEPLASGSHFWLGVTYELSGNIDDPIITAQVNFPEMLDEETTGHVLQWSEVSRKFIRQILRSRYVLLFHILKKEFSQIRAKFRAAPCAKFCDF